MLSLALSRSHSLSLSLSLTFSSLSLSRLCLFRLPSLSPCVEVVSLFFSVFPPLFFFIFSFSFGSENDVPYRVTG